MAAPWYVSGVALKPEPAGAREIGRADTSVPGEAQSIVGFDASIANTCAWTHPNRSAPGGGGWLASPEETWHTACWATILRYERRPGTGQSAASASRMVRRTSDHGLPGMIGLREPGNAAPTRARGAGELIPDFKTSLLGAARSLGPKSRSARAVGGGRRGRADSAYRPTCRREKK